MKHHFPSSLESCRYEFLEAAAGLDEGDEDKTDEAWEYICISE